MTVEDMIRILSEYPMEMRVFASKSLNPFAAIDLREARLAPYDGRDALFFSGPIEVYVAEGGEP